MCKINQSIVEAFTVEKTPDIEPSCYSQDVKFRKWLDAMDLEINVQILQGIWVLVPQFLDMNIICCKWVYRIKKKLNGEIDRYKACPIAKGFNQEVNIDFAETFCPIVKSTTIRVVLSLVVSQSWHIH